MTVTKLLGIMGAMLAPVSFEVRKLYGYEAVGVTLLLFIICGGLVKLFDGHPFPSNRFIRTYYHVLTSATAFAWAGLFAIGASGLIAGAGLVGVGGIMAIYTALGFLFSNRLDSELQRNLVDPERMNRPPAGIFGISLSTLFGWFRGE